MSILFCCIFVPTLHKKHSLHKRAHLAAENRLIHKISQHEISVIVRGRNSFVFFFSAFEKFDDYSFHENIGKVFTFVKFHAIFYFHTISLQTFSVSILLFSNFQKFPH